MKLLFDRIHKISFLIGGMTLALALNAGGSMPLTYANEEGEDEDKGNNLGCLDSNEDDVCDPQCGTNGKSLEVLSEGDSILATEIHEPLGGFDETLTSGNIEVSRVYWKWDCYEADNSSTSRYEEYSSGASCSAGTDIDCSLVQLIFADSGTGILKTYIALIYRWAAGIVGIIAVLVIVISGIQISMDQGSGEAIGAAKTRILQSLAGLAILFLSALILYTVNPTFFQK